MSTILQGVSAAVWQQLEDQAKYGLREDGITPAVLHQVVSQAQKENINVNVIPGLGKGIEKETGADWTWWLNGKTPMMVQAKKLDIVQAQASFSYLIDIAQLNTLIKAAEGYGAMPVYVFYNTGIPNAKPEDTGCTTLLAHALATFFKNYSGKQILLFSKAAELGAQSWAGLFG